MLNSDSGSDVDDGDLNLFKSYIYVKVTYFSISLLKVFIVCLFFFQCLTKLLIDYL